MGFVEPQVLFNDYRKQFSEKLLSSGMLQFAFGRILFVKAGTDATTKANSLLQQIQTIKSDKEIAEFISKNTDEAQRKAIGGKLEPHCINCGDDPFTAILKEASDKKGNSFLRKHKEIIIFLKWKGSKRFILRRSINFFKTNWIN